MTPYDVGAGTGPQEVAGGPDGQVAYTNPGAFPHEIGRLAIGATAQSLTVPGTDPFGIAFGADGAYWIALFTSDSLGRLTPEGEYSTLPGLSPGAAPAGSPRGRTTRSGCRWRRPRRWCG